MTAVKTTVTVTDLLEKRRVLDLQIVKRKGELEDVSKQKVVVSAEVDERVKKLKELSDDLDKVLGQIEGFSNIQVEADSKAVETLKLAMSMIESSLNFLSFLDKKIVKVKEEITNLNKKHNEIHNEITREQTAISRNWNDLWIYRDRLQKYIDESGAPIKLKL